VASAPGRNAIRPERALYPPEGSAVEEFLQRYGNQDGVLGEAKTIQNLYFDGKRNEAGAAVPDKPIDAISLCGPAERIRDRLEAWEKGTKAGHIGRMVLKGSGVDGLRVVAGAVLWGTYETRSCKSRLPGLTST
jgi:hypothetical protein